jgi:hypothetical protein
LRPPAAANAGGALVFAAGGVLGRSPHLAVGTAGRDAEGRALVAGTVAGTAAAYRPRPPVAAASLAYQHLQPAKRPRKEKNV